MTASDDDRERLAPVTYLRPDGTASPPAAWWRDFGGPEDSEAESDSEAADGEYLDEDWACAALEAAGSSSAYHVAISALARRALSRREVERLLEARDFAPEEARRQADRLESEGALDDLALAQTLVGILQERKGYGRTAIAAELTRRLLSPASIEYALELIDTGDELARARDLAVARARQLGGLDSATATRRLSGYLARRGYSGSTVRAAVEHALAPRRTVRFT